MVAEHFSIDNLICENSKGSVEEFQRVGLYIKSGISHMFRVGTGLDSQILGDFEIFPK
jgi:glutamyl-tRNA reductase